MPGLGAGHVRKMPLESNLEAEYAWLTLDKAERLDMSDQSFGNLASGPDMSGLTGVFDGRINF
jgi:hypothetical protein